MKLLYKILVIKIIISQIHLLVHDHNQEYDLKIKNKLHMKCKDVLINQKWNKKEIIHNNKNNKNFSRQTEYIVLQNEKY